MVWLALDPRTGQEVMLTLPRSQPGSPAALELWLRDVRQAARLDHPNLAPAVEIGSHDHWPFVAVDRAWGTTLSERLAGQPAPPPLEAVGWIAHALEGLAFAHEAGFAHLDLQLHSLVVNEAGSVRIMALGCALTGVADIDAAVHARDRALALASIRLRAQRAAAQRDLLACGVLLQGLLAGQSALDEPDTARVIDRMPPRGREPVRLRWSTPHPVPEALRVIANRATSDQERQRYHSPRTLLRALNGWREAQAQGSAGPLALVLERLRTVGHLPALPGLGARLVRLSASRGQRTDELAEQVLKDMALSFELLRTVNSAQVQGTQVSGGGPVLTLRRAIALMGVDGVCAAAGTLRTWPGPLSPAGAAALQKAMERVALACHTAQALRPVGYDAEVMYIVTLLQNLGRLLVQYHFADESEQIRQLMLPVRHPEGAEHPGMAEIAASFAVLGVDIESIGVAVARHWGLGDEVLHMIRRLPVAKPVRKPDSDADLLRSAASAANEAVDATAFGPGAGLAAALAHISQRYARVLELTEHDLRDALAAARTALGDLVFEPSPLAPETAAAGAA